MRRSSYIFTSEAADRRPGRQRWPAGRAEPWPRPWPTPALSLLVAACAPQDLPPAPCALGSATYDAGWVAVSDGGFIWASVVNGGEGPLSIVNITTVGDDGVWAVADDWRDQSTAALEIPPGSDSTASYVTVVVDFLPPAAGPYRDTLVVESSIDTCEVALRGIGVQPEAQVYPTWVDFGEAAAGEASRQSIFVRNEGRAALTVQGFEASGSQSFSVETLDPIYVLPGSVEEITLAVAPQSSAQESATILIRTDDPTGVFEIEAIVNAVSSSEPGTDTFDDDGDGSCEAAGDCDDTAERVYPGATESGNGIDDDCDGKIDEGSYGFDDDGDGFMEVGESGASDCNDNDPWVHPGAIEDCDGLDNDCDGATDEDGCPAWL